MNPEIEKRLNGCKSLPTLPTIAGEIVRLCKDDKSSLNALSTLIAKDPALAARLLSIANAPMFAGRAGPATTISQSVGRLGKNAVMTLSLSFSLARLTPSKTASFDYPRFWKRSLVSATAAGYCAEMFKLNREEAFLGGMFQDIGMLALQETFGPSYTSLIAPAGSDHFELAQLERDAMDVDHQEVGAWLVRKWKLPEYLVHTTLGSHSPFNHDVAPAIEGLVKVVALSGYAADIWMDDDNRATATCEAAECARVWLELDGDAFLKLLVRIAEAVPELARLFDVKMDGAGIDTTLDEAREALVAVSLRSALDADSAQTNVASLTQEKDAAEAQAQRDSLTGLYNRRYFDAQLAREFEKAQTLGSPLSVIFCDVDHFKSVNDTYGHAAGDAVLARLGKLLSTLTPSASIAARYGGEEFVVVLPASDRAAALVFAEQLRIELAQMDVPLSDGKTLRVTASFGCATRDDQVRAISPAALLKIADECVYLAKRAGRNRVVSPS
jgi:diguanylate cyclase (GGDEF)-like protein